MWDERYSTDAYVYGTTPNDFLVSMVDRLKKGRVLSLAEGEGRNAVYLAEHGFRVTAVDASAVGLRKARRLADRRKVTIETVVADLETFAIAPDAWDTVVSVFGHFPPALRSRILRDVVKGLTAGGTFVLEAYTPRQLEFDTGGPRTAELLMDLVTLERELAGLDIVHGVEMTRPLAEGIGHTGLGAVVQILAVKRRPLSAR